MSEHPEPCYQSYLLRLWQDGEGEPCRVMLEYVDSHERRGFADLDELCAFLHQIANGGAESGERGSPATPGRETV